MRRLGGSVFLETERLRLRQFTADDADLLVALDADPDVMRFITGGTPTPREEIVDEVLPAYLSYYRRFPGYWFLGAGGAADERLPGLGRNHPRGVDRASVIVARSAVDARPATAPR